MAKGTLAALSKKLLSYALSFPEATLDHPWGENVAKVKKKVFVFFGMPNDTDLGLSVKLPKSGGAVLMSPFAKPTGYGLGKAGWVTLTFRPGDDVPVPLIESWIVESYRAVAPKKLADSLGAENGAEKTTTKAKKPANKSKAKPKKAAAPRAKKARVSTRGQ
jgi:predicted DNA-binding protein (MmcQ/YjbR family)